MILVWQIVKRILNGVTSRTRQGPFISTKLFYSSSLEALFHHVIIMINNVKAFVQAQINMCVVLRYIVILHRIL